MPRPCHCRRVGGAPDFRLFKPAGIPARQLEWVELGLDEWEALRLADREGYYHDEAARRMGVSRPTFGRVLESARRKLAEALVEGKALEIEGGKVMMNAKRKFACADCQHTWELPHGTGRPESCPACGSQRIQRAEEDRGYARAGGGPGQGRGRRRRACVRAGGNRS